MKDIAARLTILVEDGGVFTDVSDALCDFGTDTVTATITTAKTLWLGYRKPITSIFVYASTYSTGTRSLIIQGHTQNGYETFQHLDDSLGLTRAGNVTWLYPDTRDGIESTVNGIKLHWLKVKVSVDTSAMVLKTLSGLFSDDRDLEREFPKINEAGFRLGKTDHILIHESARDEIVQQLRNRGLRTVSPSLAVYRRLVFWDMLDIQEVRLASTYLALSKIFENVANADKEDNWRVKANLYSNKFKSAIDLAFITFDRLQNGDVNVQRDISVGVLSR
jgi:hypothetical protein